MLFYSGMPSLKRRLLLSTLCLYAIYCNLCEACPTECICIPAWEGEVNCEAVGLFEIPADIPSSAKVFNLGSNFIDSINEEYFQNMQQLTEINLQGNSVHEIPPNSFVHLTELKILNLRFNRIYMLPSEVFTGLTKLRTLDLRGNNINRMDNQAFEPLFNLQVLDFHGNNLRRIPEGLFWNLRSLQYLDLGKNRLSSISSANVFRGLGNLTLLDLRDNKDLRSLPRRMADELPSLKSLILQGCNVHPLKSEMLRGFNYLEELQLQNTGQEKSLHLGVFDNAPNLKTLRLDNNKLVSLHESMISKMDPKGIMFLQNNFWDCSCGLLSIRGRWPMSKPNFLHSGITCETPSLWKREDLWNIPLQHLHAHCMSEPSNIVKTMSLPKDSSFQLLLDCEVPQFGPYYVLDWITPEGYYVSQFSVSIDGRYLRDQKYQLLSNGTLVVNEADSGNYMCIITMETGGSARTLYRVTFRDGFFWEPASPEDRDPESNNPAFLLPTTIIVAVLVIITIVVAWLRFCREKEVDDKPYDSPFKEPVPVRNMDHAYAYVSVGEKNREKRKRDISAYAINALFLQLPELGNKDKHSGYDHVKGQRPKSHSCRERGSKYPAPAPSRPSNTIGSRATANAESGIYITPVNSSGMEDLIPSRFGNSDPEMTIPIYGATQMPDAAQSLKPLRESKSVDVTSGRRSNPYLELIA